MGKKKPENAQKKKKAKALPKVKKVKIPRDAAKRAPPPKRQRTEDGDEHVVAGVPVPSTSASSTYALKARPRDSNGIKILTHRSDDIKFVMQLVHGKPTTAADYEAYSTWTQGSVSVQHYFATVKELCGAGSTGTGRFSKMPAYYTPPKKTVIEKTVRIPQLNDEEAEIFNLFEKGTLIELNSNALTKINKLVMAQYQITCLTDKNVTKIDLNQTNDFEWYGYTYGTPEDGYKCTLDPIVGELYYKTLTIENKILSMPDIFPIYKKAIKSTTHEEKTELTEAAKLEAFQAVAEASTKLWNKKSRIIKSKTVEINKLMQQSKVGIYKLKKAWEGSSAQQEANKKEAVHIAHKKISRYLDKSLKLAVENKICNENAVKFIQDFIKNGDEYGGVGKLRSKHYRSLDFTAIKFLAGLGGIIQRTNEAKDAFQVNHFTF